MDLFITYIIPISMLEDDNRRWNTKNARILASWYDVPVSRDPLSIVSLISI
jgi:hypothetical protein